MSFSEQPPIFHVTHWKAGSQWVYSIFRNLFPKRTVVPREREAHVLDQPIQKGFIYPTIYMSKEHFDNFEKPANHIRFFVMRDIRDTTISRYFSVRYSHPVQFGTQTFDSVSRNRHILSNLSTEEGIRYTMRHLMPYTATIQQSWMNGNEVIVRYEDMLFKEYDSYRAILDRCQLQVDNDKLKKVVKHNSFKQITGRERGEEDVASHYRKGIVGDWKNYFTVSIKAEFKELYGDVLIKTGYEDNLNW